jgi:hypothetical protein
MFASSKSRGIFMIECGTGSLERAREIFLAMFVMFSQLFERRDAEGVSDRREVVPDGHGLLIGPQLPL